MQLRCVGNSANPLVACTLTLTAGVTMQARPWEKEWERATPLLYTFASKLRYRVLSEILQRFIIFIFIICYL
jgi:hypothetical protein